MKRKMYIDIAKGIGISFVVFAHIYQNFDKGINQIIYSFHMPLFFVLSGLLFCFCRGKELIMKRVRSILVPYIFWAVLSVLYWLIFERQFRAAEAQIPVGKAFAGVFIASYPYLMLYYGFFRFCFLWNCYLQLFMHLQKNPGILVYGLWDALFYVGT